MTVRSGCATWLAENATQRRLHGADEVVHREDDADVLFREEDWHFGL